MAGTGVIYTWARRLSAGKRAAPTATVARWTFPKINPQRHIQRIALQAFLINIANPKLSIFFLAFLPQFMPSTAANPLADMLVLSAVFMGLTAVVFALYGLAAAHMKVLILGRPVGMTWLKRGFVGAFGALGMRLALSDR